MATNHQALFLPRRSGLMPKTSGRTTSRNWRRASGMPLCLHRETDGGLIPPHILATAQVPPRSSMIWDGVLSMRKILAAANFKCKPPLSFFLLALPT